MYNFLLSIFLVYVTFYPGHINAMNELQKNISCNQIYLGADLHDIEYVKIILNKMYESDQQVRTQYIHDRSNQKLIDCISDMDDSHTKIIKAIIAVHGWPSISLFGIQADNQAWLLVQHADHDVAFQQQCLSLLELLLPLQDTNMKNYAYLYDRVALNRGEKQKYGTQCSVSHEGLVTLRPYQGTLQDVDAYREHVGLMPLNDYIEQIKSLNAK